MAGETDGGCAGCAALRGQVEALQEQLAAEMAKCELLAQQAVAAEDTLLEQDVASFGDVIPNEDREFWRGQLLENREGAVGALQRMRGRVQAPVAVPAAEPAAEPVKPAAAAPVAAAPRPLHNRETAKPPVAPAVAPAVPDRATRIRNRATEIAKRDGTHYMVAFRQAEQEIG